MTKFAFVFAFSALFTAPGFGGLVAPSSLAGLATSSTLIVSGSVSGIVQSGSVAVITLTVGRVVAGDPIAAGSTISVNREHNVGGPGPVFGHVDSTPPVNTNGLWFLHGSSGAWLLAPVWQGDVPLGWTFIPQPSGPLPAAYSYASDALVTDKVAAEVSFGIENAASSGFPLEQIEDLLDALNSTYVQTLYQRLSVSASAPQQIRGLAGLIRGGSAAAFGAAANSAASFVNYPAENGLLLLSISGGFRAADPASVAALGQAAVSPAVNQAFREASAHALARIHTAAALPYLATLLDDPDDALRIEAVGGFSSFANGLPVQTAGNNAGLAHLRLPASGPFKTPETIGNFAMGQQAISANETKYISFWKTWWSEQSAKLTQ